MRSLILVTTGSFAMAGIATAQATLFDLSFMAGCWQGDADTSGPLVIEERYTPPSGNVMLGTTRYLKQGKAVQFEFTLLRDSDGVELLPYPGGHPSMMPFA